MTEIATTIRPKNDTTPEAPIGLSPPSPTASEIPVSIASRRNTRLFKAAKLAFEGLWALFWAVVDELLAARQVPTDDSRSEWVDQESSPLKKHRHCALVRKGILKGHKVGKRVLVRREDVDRYIESQEGKTQPPEPNQDEDIDDEIDRNLTKLGFTTKEDRKR